MNTQGTPCPECGAYKGHGIECSLQTKEDWKEQALLYHKAWSELMAGNDKTLRLAIAKHKELQKMVTFWQGKYLICKRENNALRKTLPKRRKANERLTHIARCLQSILQNQEYHKCKVTTQSIIANCIAEALDIELIPPSTKRAKPPE